MRISDWSSDVCSSDLRTWSTHDDSFWCCVGSGMESHSKHGDSIYWHDASTLYVNLFIASTLDWDGWKLELATRFPFDDQVPLTVTKLGQTRALAPRPPACSNDPTIAPPEPHPHIPPPARTPPPPTHPP